MTRQTIPKGAFYAYFRHSDRDAIPMRWGTSDRCLSPGSVLRPDFRYYFKMVVDPNRSPSVRSIRIPSTIEVICDHCFAGCVHLSNVTFEAGSTVVILGVSAFAYCESLPSICLPASLETICADCFSDCKSLSEITVEAGSHLSTIDQSAIRSCPLLRQIPIQSHRPKGNPRATHLPTLNPDTFKVVILGNVGVGKTWITEWAVNGVARDPIPSTLCIQYYNKTVEVGSLKVHLQLWDTWGQERFYSFNRAHFRGTNVALIVYAINDENSFVGVDRWVEILDKSDCSNALKVLIASKSDLEGDRVISMERGEKKAQEMNAMFIEVSAKIGSRMDELFDDIASICQEMDDIEPKPRAGVVLTETKNEGRGCC